MPEVDVTENYIRLRQADPGQFQEGSFRTITLDVAKGIKAVIGKPNGKSTTMVQSYLFDKEKWDTARAEAWVAEHKTGHRSRNVEARWNGIIDSGEGADPIRVVMHGAHFQLVHDVEDPPIEIQVDGITLNTAGVEHARALIRAGHVDEGRAWSLSAAVQNRILGDPPNWTRYASWHLGVNGAAKEKTKDRYRFPFGDGRNVNRAALGSAAQRASQFGYDPISKAASGLIELMDEGEDAQASGLSFVASGASFDGDHVERGEDGIPTAFRIVPWGKWSTNKYGPITVDKQSAKTVMAWYEHRGMKKLPIDHDHQIFASKHNGMPAPAVGWYALEVRDDGIWATDLEWSDQAREWLRTKAYRHFSPTGKLEAKTNRLLTIDTIALTNIPDTNSQPPLVADAAPEDATATLPSKEITMEAVLTTLGLKPEATEDEAVKAIKDLQASAGKVEGLEGKIKEFEASATDSDELAALREFQATTLEACKLDKDKGAKDVMAYVSVLQAKEPKAAEAVELAAKVEALEKKAEEARIKDLMASVGDYVSPENKDRVEKLARTLDEELFMATVTSMPNLKGQTKAPISDPKLADRNRPPKDEELLTTEDREFIASKGFEKGSAEEKAYIADFIKIRKGELGIE